MASVHFLPGVPHDHVLSRLRAAGGKEIESGKFASPESSAALAVNCFGWFVERPELMPALPGLGHIGRPELVDVEFCARFPWSGGRHPWLDAVVQTSSTLVGVESKRFEPFRDKKSVSLSEAYDRPVWGERMQRYERMRDRLRTGEERFRHLDAAQLVKHAFGLVTEGRRRERRPVLFYIFAEPTMRSGWAIERRDIDQHREEVVTFASKVEGDEVAFRSSSYGDWLAEWPGAPAEVQAHRDALVAAFQP